MVPVELVSAMSLTIAVGTAGDGLYFEFKVAAQPGSNITKKILVTFACIDPPKSNITLEVSRPVKQVRLE
jgi:hypothetical protein